MPTNWLEWQLFPEESLPVLKNAYALLLEKASLPFQKAREALLMPSTAAFQDATKDVLSLADVHPYTLNLLLCASCLDELRERYQNAGKEDLFRSYKEQLATLLRSCKDTSGIWGIKNALWNWMFHELGCVRLGRLLFEPYFHFSTAEYNSIKRGDRVILIHIPGGEKLDMTAVEQALQLGYAHFKDRFENGIVPFVTDSWLIYPPYLEGVFKEGSNLEKFARLFTVIEESTDAFSNFRTVFGIPYSEENLACVPQDTSLQRNMLRFIKDGNKMGRGYGIFFYGENGIIK